MKARVNTPKRPCVPADHEWANGQPPPNNGSVKSRPTIHVEFPICEMRDSKRTFLVDRLAIKVNPGTILETPYKEPLRIIPGCGSSRMRSSGMLAREVGDSSMAS